MRIYASLITLTHGFVDCILKFSDFRDHVVKMSMAHNYLVRDPHRDCPDRPGAGVAKSIVMLAGHRDCHSVLCIQGAQLGLAGGL